MTSKLVLIGTPCVFEFLAMIAVGVVENGLHKSKCGRVEQEHDKVPRSGKSDRLVGEEERDNPEDG